MKNRKTIGRTLATKELISKSNSSEPHSQTFTLASGKKATFKLKHIDANRLKEVTFVEMSTNGRDQSALTEAAVSDITRTLGLNQFFPAIGRSCDDRRIEILDGSRRRAAAIFINTGLDVLVTDEHLTVADARQLAADIQTAREHNLREIGLRLTILRDNGMDQKDIALSEGMSAAKVSRAIQAASVPQSMLELFPVQSELTYPDYKMLLELDKAYAEKQLDLSALVQSVGVQLEKVDSQLPAEQYKDVLIKLYKAEAQLQLSAPKKAKVITKQLRDFQEKDKFARRKEGNRTVNYEFSRMPKSLIKEIDEAVAQLLKQHFDD